MSYGPPVPPKPVDPASVRRLGSIKNGNARNTLYRQLRNQWSLLLSNVMRTTPRLRSADVAGLLAPDGTPTLVPPWDLPLDVVWGTDRPDNGRAFVLLAVEDEGTGEKAVFVAYEQQGPTNLPVAVARLAGTVTLVGEPPLADTEDTFRGLLKLFRDGRATFRRQAGADPAALEETTLALQFTKTGFAPTPARAKPDGQET